MTSLCFTFQKFLDKSVEESGDKEKSEDYSVSLRHITKISTLALLLLVLFSRQEGAYSLNYRQQNMDHTGSVGSLMTIFKFYCFNYIMKTPLRLTATPI